MHDMPTRQQLSCVARFVLFLVAALYLGHCIFQAWKSEIPSSRKLPIRCRTESNMQFISFNYTKEKARGEMFDCSLKPYLEKWKISDEFLYKSQPINASSVVFVTYASSNHFGEARNGIRSMRSMFKNKIIFYDLGLQESEVDELHNVCNLEIRKFAFENYPDFVSVLSGYNFKPIIMAEMFGEYNYFWMVDSSVRFFDVHPNLDSFYDSVSAGITETVAVRHPVGHSIFATTDPRMYRYLPMDTEIAKELEMIEATMFISRSDFSREAIKWHALCALTKECMAPPHSNLYCNFKQDRYENHANCHRYDQSSINIILASMLDRDGWKRRDRANDDPFKNFLTVSRGDADQIPLFIPCRGN